MNINDIHKRQQDYFNSNKTKDVSFRVTQLKTFKKVLKENENLLYQAINNDFGKRK